MSKNFDKFSNEWQSYQEKPWGRLLYVLCHQYLNPYIPLNPCRILDLGGGNGLSAIKYAQNGHHVTILDISEDLLDDALKSARDAGVENLIEVHHCDVLELSSLYPEPIFDVVLCHNVLAYTENIPKSITVIFDCLQENGVLSLISINRFSEVFREAIHQSNPKSALEKIDSNQHVSATFKVSKVLYTPDEMLSFFSDVALTVEDQFGIRCVNDYIPDDEIKNDQTFYNNLEELELILGKTYPYNLLARFFQIVFRKI